MKLEEALNICKPTQYLARDEWIKNGSLMRLMSSYKTIHQIKESLEFTQESLNADDWNIYEINQ